MAKKMMYKCRLCNKIYVAGTVPDKYVTWDIMEDKLPRPGVTFGPISNHMCNEDNIQYGVTDFIGLVHYSDDNRPALSTNTDPQNT